MKMNKLFALLLVFVTTVSQAQRNVEFVVPFAPGGSADHIALSLAGAMREELSHVGITPVLTYRQGGGSIIGAASVASSDRLQILMTPIAVVSAPIVNSINAKYDAKTDLIPLGYIGNVQSLMVTNNLSIKSVQDLVKECQRKPVTFGSAGVGSISHIMAESVLQHLHCTGVHVPYKGMGPAVADLIGQHIDIVVDFVPSIGQKVDANLVIPLVMVQQQRDKNFPNVPAMGDLGYKNYEIATWFVLSVSNKVSKDDVVLIRPALTRVLHRPDVVKELQNSGLHNIGKRIPDNFFEIQYNQLEKVIKVMDLNAK